MSFEFLVHFKCQLFLKSTKKKWTPIYFYVNDFLIIWIQKKFLKKLKRHAEQVSLVKFWPNGSYDIIVIKLKANELVC